MHVAEIAIEGLEGAAEFSKVEIASGLAVLAAAPREALFRRVLLDLLYPKEGDSALKPLIVDERPARVGVTLQAVDGTEYRLLLEVATNRRVLQRIVAGNAEVMCTTAADIASAVRQILAFPVEELFRDVFLCTPEQLPSMAGPGAALDLPPGLGVLAGASLAPPGVASTDFAETSGPNRVAPPPPGFGESSQPMRRAPSTPPPATADGNGTRRPGPPGFNDAGPASKGPKTPAQLRARLVEIDAMIARDATARALEFDLDGVQKQIFEVERRLAPLATLRAEVKRALEKYRGFDEVASVSKEVIELVDKLPGVRAEHKNQLNRMGLERRRLFDQFGELAPDGIVPGPTSLVVNDQLVKRGMMGGVGAIAIAVAGSFVSPDIRWVALLDIPAFAVALISSVRLIGEVERMESLDRRIKRLDDEERGHAERHDLHERKVKKQLEQNQLSAEDIPEVTRKLGLRADAEAALNAARVAFEKAQQDPEIREAGRQQGELQERMRSLEDELSAAAAGLPSMTDLRNERAEVEAELNVATKDEGEGSSSAAAENSGARPASPDAIGRLVLGVSESISLPFPELAAALRPRTVQVLTSLSDNKLRDVMFSTRANTAVADSSTGGSIRFSELSLEDQDAVWISVKVAVLEHLLKQGRMPVIVDGGFDRLSDVRGSLARKLLQFLGTLTQVVSISGRPALGPRTA